MSIKVHCEHCGKEYELPKTYLGKKVKCKACEQAFVVREDFPTAPKSGLPPMGLGHKERKPLLPRKDDSDHDFPGAPKRRFRPYKTAFNRDHFVWVWSLVATVLVVGFFLPWLYQPGFHSGYFNRPSKLFFAWTFIAKAPFTVGLAILMGPIVGLGILIFGKNLKGSTRGTVMLLAGVGGCLSLFLLLVGKGGLGLLINKTTAFLNILSFLCIFLSLGGSSVLIFRHGKEGARRGQLLAGIPAGFYLLWTGISFLTMLSKFNGPRISRAFGPMQGFATLTMIAFVVSSLALIGAAILSLINISRGDKNTAHLAVKLNLIGLGLISLWLIVILPFYIMITVPKQGLMMGFFFFVCMANILGRFFGYPLLIGYGLADLILEQEEIRERDFSVDLKKFD